MKIAIAGGHSKAAPGAHGYLDEYTEDRAVASALLAELQRRGVEVASCTNEKTTQGSELAEECRLANLSGADLFVAIHFNAASNTDGTRGVETWFHTGSSAQSKAVAVTNKLAQALGLPNRGAKATKGLYVLNHTNMPAILVEVCFIDAQGDANAYRALGAQGVACAIADGILGATSQPVSQPVAKPAPQPVPKPAAKPSAKIDEWVGRLQAECNAQGFSKQVVDKIAGKITLVGCPTCRKGARGKITALVQERLNSKGFNCGTIDGIFGSGTENAVKAFQRAMGLTADGIVGVNTWTKLLGL